MANSVPTNHFVDKNTLLAQDLARNRQITLNLQQKFAPISDALWSEHQQALYPDMLQVRNPPSLVNLLANTLESTNQTDSLQLEALGMTNLLTITDQDTANYILDRLNDDDINNMNQNFPSILKTIKTKYTNMNKDKFIDIVKSKQSYIPEHDITERGQRRQNSEAQLKAQQKNDYEEVLSQPSRDAEVRAMREHDRMSAPRERGVKAPVERDTLHYPEIYDERNVTPQKKNPMLDTPNKMKKDYGALISEGEVKTTNEEEEKALQAIKKKVENFRTNQDVRDYIKEFSGRSVLKLNRPQLNIIGIRLGYNDKMGGEDGVGVTT